MIAKAFFIVMNDKKLLYERSRYGINKEVNDRERGD